MRQFKITVNGKTYDVQVEENGVATTAPVVTAPAVSTASAVATTPAAAVPETTTPAAATVPETTTPAAPAAAGEGTAVEAPMPGTILKILVSNGQAVKNGDAVVVLEAMKMENEITAPCDGTVTAVCVNTGDNVDAGKVLVTIK